jgi:hypothetical protein
MRPRSPGIVRIRRAAISIALGSAATVLLSIVGLEAHARNSGYLTPLWRSQDAMILHNPKPAFAHRQASHRVGGNAPDGTYPISLEHLPWWAVPAPQGSEAAITTAASGWPLPALRTVYDMSAGAPAPRTITRTWKSASQLSHRSVWLVPNQIIWPGFLTNTLGFAAGIFAALTAIGLLRVRARIRRGECGRCRYQRQGLPPGAPCPECGHEPCRPT